METTPQHLFAEPDYQIVQASGGKRFMNYLIDLVSFYALIFVAGMVIGLVNPSAFDYVDDESLSSTVIDRLVGLILYGLYMFVTEALFKGKTLGKLLTGTRAVNEDGSNISVKTALLRGLSRMVPFEVFSALGSPSYPWHDSWTKTYVIDEKASNRPEDL